MKFPAPALTSHIPFQLGHFGGAQHRAPEQDYRGRRAGAPVPLVPFSTRRLYRPVSIRKAAMWEPARCGHARETCSSSVVGIVGDTKSVTLQAPPRLTAYVPMTAAFGGSVVRTDVTADFAAQLRSAIAAIDPGQRVRQVRTMHDIVALTSATSRFNATLFGSGSCCSPWRVRRATCPRAEQRQSIRWQQSGPGKATRAGTGDGSVIHSRCAPEDRRTAGVAAACRLPHRRPAAPRDDDRLEHRLTKTPLTAVSCAYRGKSIAFPAARSHVALPLSSLSALVERERERQWSTDSRRRSSQQ
jgi:hypothetical protein